MGTRVLTGFNIGQDLKAFKVDGNVALSIQHKDKKTFIQELTHLMEFEPVWDLERDKFCFRIECARNGTDDLTTYVLLVKTDPLNIHAVIHNRTPGSYDEYIMTDCKLVRYGMGRFKPNSEVRQTLYFEIGVISRIIHDGLEDEDQPADVQRDQAESGRVTEANR